MRFIAGTLSFGRCISHVGHILNDILNGFSRHGAGLTHPRAALPSGAPPSTRCSFRSVLGALSALHCGAKSERALHNLRCSLVGFSSAGVFEVLDVSAAQGKHYIMCHSFANRTYHCIIDVYRRRGRGRAVGGRRVAREAPARRNLVTLLKELFLFCRSEFYFFDRSRIRFSLISF